MNRKISDLPRSPVRELLSKCERDGLELVGGKGIFGTNAEPIILIGLAKMILELKKRVERLEK